jgi:hypothetical protein
VIDVYVPVVGDPIPVSSLSADFLSPDDNIAGKREDKEVNAPMSHVCRHFVPVSYTVALTINSCNLVDFKGREQREDILILRGRVQEWPDLITMIVGKLDLQLLSPWKVALGQACRRANAILDSQPWRVFVVIPMTSMADIAFLLMDQAVRRPSVSPRSACLSKIGNDVVIGSGFNSLAAFLSKPHLLGYVRCPVQLSSVSVEALSATRVMTLCARNNKKCVFLLHNDAGSSFVVKAYDDRSRAAHEIAVLQKIAKIDGVPKLVESVHGVASRRPVSVQVSRDSVLTECHALAMMPYCSALTNSIATPALFACYASVLAHAAALDVNNNDVSPDNLLISMNANTGVASGILTDWELATTSGSKIGDIGFTGTYLFACDAAFEEGGRTSSLLCDLESLYYAAVAISTSVGAVWGDHASGASSMVSERRRFTGLGALRARFHSYLPSEDTIWGPYLDRVGVALKRVRDSEVTVDAAGAAVLAAFVRTSS